MTYYFIKDGDNETGPFTVQQLKLKLIQKDTLVWSAGIQEWTNAGQVYELKELFTPKLSSVAFAKNKIVKILSNKLLKQNLKKVSYQVIFNKERKSPF
jgi:hypothetical protein